MRWGIKKVHDAPCMRNFYRKEDTCQLIHETDSITGKERTDKSVYHDELSPIIPIPHPCVYELSLKQANKEVSYVYIRLIVLLITVHIIHLKSVVS
jgi:hypothetical protein